MNSSFVYMMQAREYLKIGVTSSSIEKRAKAIQTGCPLPITEIFFFNFETRQLAFNAEHLLHCELKEYNTHGEWFLAFKGFGTKIEKLLGKKYTKIPYKQFYNTLDEDIKIKMIDKQNKIKLRQAKREKLFRLEEVIDELETAEKSNISFHEHRENMKKMKKINDKLREVDKIKRRREKGRK